MQHQLRTMPAWCQQRQVVGIANNSHKDSCQVAADACSPQLSKEWI